MCEIKFHHIVKIIEKIDRYDTSDAGWSTEAAAAAGIVGVANKTGGGGDSFRIFGDNLGIFNGGGLNEPLFIFIVTPIFPDSFENI